MNQQELALVAAAAKEANGLIEQRTFSWTELFNQLEATLPEDVMLTAVRPEFKDGVTHVNMEISGPPRRGHRCVLREARGDRRVSRRLVERRDVTEDGLHHMTMTAVYAPERQGVRPARRRATPKGSRR